MVMIVAVVLVVDTSHHTAAQAEGGVVEGLMDASAHLSPPLAFDILPPKVEDRPRLISHSCRSYISPDLVSDIIIRNFMI